MSQTDEKMTLPLPWTRTEKIWFCSKDGLNYVSPKCGHGGTHRRVTMTVRVELTEGWDQDDRTEP